MHWLSKFIYYKLLGWNISGNTNMSKDVIKKAVIIAAPHTSWHDFYIGILLRKILRLKTNFIAKKELFIPPLSWYLKSIGGLSIDRESKHDTVNTIVNLFNKKEEFRITIAPEGTRKKVEKWRTGFYYIAKNANVPIIMFTLDFAKKENKVSEPFYLTGDKEEDFKVMQGFFKNVVGKVPEKS